MESGTGRPGSASIGRSVNRIPGNGQHSP
jgi:hypothetical protein